MDIPRSIAVIDVGATNTKLFHIRPDLAILDSRSQPAVLLDGPPYLQIDAGAVLEFAKAAIAAFDAVVPVDAIVTSCHGSALALLDGGGELALPIMSYLAEVPEDVAQAYARIAPSFDEVLAPTNPGALTLGRQLLWQHTRWPEAFATVRLAMPYAQYIGYRLTGVAASEVSSLGAQTHLWAPGENAFSSLARRRGWDRLMAPLRGAGDVLGAATGLALNGRGLVHCGIHDSNANFLRYARHAPLCLLSTGTWIIAFDSEAPVNGLDGTRDQVSNTTITGQPVACARFMGGEEFARIAGEGETTRPSLADVADLVGSEVFAFPSFTDSGGPVPRSGGQGRVSGRVPEDGRALSSLASLYTAQMTALTLQGLGGTDRVVVDGVFASNDVFLALLAALLPARRIFRSQEMFGAATGAASLALPDLGATRPPELERVAPAEIDGLAAYHDRWLREAGAQ